MFVTNRRIALTLGALAIATPLVLSGCSGSSDDSSSASPSATESVKAEVNGDNASVKDGKNLDLPEGWPKDLPMPEGVAINNVVDTDGKTVITAATTYDTVDATIDGFKDTWTSEDVTISDVTSTQVAGTLTATLTDGTVAKLAVTMTGDTATIIITETPAE